MVLPAQKTFPPEVIHGANVADPVVVLVCEHASNSFPEEFGTLGLSDADRQAHVAWDPGAFGVALALQEALQADLVAGTVSRLIYDCNRPPEAESAYPPKSEVFEIPGNTALNPEDKAARAMSVYFPFREALRSVMDARGEGILVTVHSFTPIFHGQKRACEIGILHDGDRRLADLLLEGWPSDAPLKAERNVPYGPADGVTHTLKEHPIPRGWPNVMLEIRNDLIETPTQQRMVAQLIADRLRAAFLQLKVKPHD
ncbi:N-formylglutamate amidohydrolase [Cereibacter sphaeroides]|nr:N-formylglutamate amidohydrolase [Cereibacter sphaeroides]